MDDVGMRARPDIQLSKSLCCVSTSLLPRPTSKACRVDETDYGIDIGRTDYRWRDAGIIKEISLEDCTYPHPPPL